VCCVCMLVFMSLEGSCRVETPKMEAVGSSVAWHYKSEDVTFTSPKQYHAVREQSDSNERKYGTHHIL
jgi:hypothetical protein